MACLESMNFGDSGGESQMALLLSCPWELRKKLYPKDMWKKKMINALNTAQKKQKKQKQNGLNLIFVCFEQILVTTFQSFKKKMIKLRRRAIFSSLNATYILHKT